MSEVRYAYAVSPVLYNGNLLVQRTQILKETARTVMLERGLAGYRYNRRLEPEQVHRTFDEAVAAFIRAKKQEIDGLAEQIRRCNEMMAKTPIPDYREDP